MLTYIGQFSYGATAQLHSLVTTAAFKGAKVDKENRRITGFVVTSIGPALGHGERIDEESLRQVVAMGNGSEGSAGPIRARMDHPPRGDMTVENPLSKLLGRPMNFRIDGDRVIADLQLLSVSAAPESDRLLDLALEAPDLFGASLVFDYADADTHMALVKKGKNPPVRFGTILAVDFVDLPATNPSGLFSMKTHIQETAMAGKCSAYVRNGALYGNMGDGGEFEIELPDEIKAMKKAAKKEEGDGDEDDKKGGAHAIGTTVDVEKVKADAIAEERAYRTNFHTAMTTAGITGKEAVEFEAAFYKRPIDDVKYLASHAIGTRAKPVGEGGAPPETTPKTEDESAKVAAAATARWHSDVRLRKMHGILSNNPTDSQYVQKLARYVGAAQKSATDQKGSADFDKVGENDPITAALANKNMCVRV